MSAAVRAVIVAMIWLATPAKVSGGVDLIFSDSFEECLAEPLVLWSGSGDGTSWSDPLNWKGNQLPAANAAVRIRGLAEVTGTFDNSAGTVSINCLVSDESILISGGALSIAARSSINADLNISGGTLSAADKLKVNGALQHTGGTLGGVGLWPN